MNKFLSAILLACVLFSCDIRDTKNKKEQAKNEQQPIVDSTTVQMIDSVYNFGTVTDGEKVEYSFRFRNTGKNPLIVTDTHTSCGCTVSEKPEQPVKPGETGFIKVVFNSSGKVGDVQKSITVTSNAFPGFPELMLTGKVKDKEK